MRIGNAIYLDHQATTPVDQEVLVRMLPYLGDRFGNPHSSEHAFGWDSARAVEKAAAQIASLIGADPDEVIFTSGATEANNLALLGLAGGSLSQDRCKVLLGSADHKSTLAVGRALQERGFEATYLRVDSAGHIDLEQLQNCIDPSTLVVSICAVNSEIGTIQNIAEISSIVRAHGVLLHWDAAQAPCAMDTSGLTESADLISLSAHKMYGPKGIGALYVRRSTQRSLQPIIHGGGQQSKLRSGTLPAPLCVGFGAAAELLAGPQGEKERSRVCRQRDLLVRLLSDLAWPVKLNGPAFSIRHPGNANIRFEGFSAHDLLAIMQPKLAASTGSACASGTPEPSYVLRSTGLSDDQAASSLRLCVGRFTRDEDIYEAVNLVTGALERLSEIGLREAVA